MTFLAAIPDYLYDMQVGSAAVIALLGYAVVFFGIVLLMCVMIVMGKAFTAKSAKEKTVKAAPKAETAAAAPVAAEPVGEPAPGSAGKLKLYDTPDRDAAMIMAIVANKMGKPLNELRFISIKEVK